MKKVSFKNLLSYVFMVSVMFASSGSIQAAEKKPVLAFLPGSFSNASQSYAAKMFIKHADAYGFEVKAEGNETGEIQAANVLKYAEAGADVIVVNPNDIVTIVPSLQKAREAGAIIGLFSSDLPAELTEIRDIFCGVDDQSAGEVAAKAFIKQFPEGAKIVEIGGQNGHDAQLKRTQGFHNIIDSSNIEVLAVQNCKAWSTEDAKENMDELLTVFGDEIQGVFCHWDNGITGIISALEEAGVDNVFLVGVDGCSNGFQQILDGKQSITIAQNIENLAKTMMERTNQKLAGESFEDVNFIAFETIGKDNINDYDRPEW